jgi:hypothetical protein
MKKLYPAIDQGGNRYTAYGLHSYGLEALFTFVSIGNINTTPSSFVQGSKLPPGYKRRISRSVGGLLESYGPYKQNPITTTYKNVVLKIAGHCNFEGPLRLFICISMAPRWLGFCDIEPRYNLLSVGHSKPCVLTSIFKGIHWCYSIPLLYF